MFRMTRVQLLSLMPSLSALITPPNRLFTPHANLSIVQHKDNKAESSNLSDARARGDKEKASDKGLERALGSRPADAAGCRVADEWGY